MKSLFIVLMAVISLSAATESGKIAFVKGEVSLIRDNRVAPAQAGEVLEVGDVIKTGPDGRAKLLFLDETVMVVGKSTVFKTESYAFDKRAGKYDAQFKVAEGFFKTITGQIGKVAKEKFALKTKTATMGIRGTIFGGEVAEDYENIYCLKGAITVESGGQTKVVESGFMTSIKGGGTPSEPKKITPAEHLKFNQETSTLSFGQCKVK